jgi:hypothetical protein
MSCKYDMAIQGADEGGAAQDGQMLRVTTPSNAAGV